MKLGANYQDNDRCEFTVWAPTRHQVAVHLVSPTERVIPMQPQDHGYWRAEVENVPPGTLYFYRLDDDLERTDPASHWQPQGVHGPSAVVNHQSFPWTDTAWRSFPLTQWIIYELHVGTFTPEGTFDAVIGKLPYLKELGITAIEIMPVAPFPGDRNWGYDGVYIYGVQESYGGPDGFKRLINACHEQEIAVILDVVYNHLGPEGNYLWAYGPYFTDKYHTPWGSALNFDDADSNEVRNFFIENALYWLETYHLDGLRLDAIHAIYDMSAQPFLQRLGLAVDKFNKYHSSYPRYLIAESDLNDVKVLRLPEQGGFGHHSQWCDDFHHALHTVLTQEKSGYYIDFGDIEQLATAMRQGYVYAGQYSQHRRRDHGNIPDYCDPEQFVIFSQNHDQVGNRLGGDRLSTLVSFEALKLAAGLVFLSPFVPLLFMGEEYGETNPFQYFVSHTDPGLIEGVRKGRAEEFKSFGWQNEVPDPQGEKVFQESKLNWELVKQDKNKILLAFYKHLIQLRKTKPALQPLPDNTWNVATRSQKVICLYRVCDPENQMFCFINLYQEAVTLPEQYPPGYWRRIFDSSDQEWGGPGSLLPPEQKRGLDLIINPLSFAIYEL